ncbi:hypothetical protein Ao3042_04807 [Aspergillus oryzae 3.042]|uniref:Uncharacterized protein n=1 Tax=Aspergillus oryzae (strain 3.042) TaxID=1160506 RepID=I8A1W6_ASPO3|nr:hypothetical protein Ao3042_04807 [Aspergillus oryzae 3.042]|eukprot:EIT78842.1 hypothetical protein Ao3042_04807 [Aspergillus oryzae 3.042]
MGTAIPGVAALAVNNSDSDSGSGSGSGSDSNNNSTCDDADYKLKEKALDNHDVAIGVGVGVPLGVIAIASIAWALYDLSGSMNMGGNGNMGGNMGMGGMPLAELNTTQASAQRPVELDSDAVILVIQSCPGGLGFSVEHCEWLVRIF